MTALVAVISILYGTAGFVLFIMSAGGQWSRAKTITHRFAITLCSLAIAIVWPAMLMLPHNEVVSDE